LDLTGLLNDIFVGAYRIGEGRKGFATFGKEQEGRVSYENGIALALAAFREAQQSGDTQTIILAELVFLNQELQFCNKADAETINSLNHAIHDFGDAMRSIEAVEDVAGYKIAEKTHSTDPKKCVEGFPADVFHQACKSHLTRIRNIIRAPGIAMLEKALLRQRALNIKAAQAAYIEKQRKALEDKG
jgi:hypothetical protein